MSDPTKHFGKSEWRAVAVTYERKCKEHMAEIERLRAALMDIAGLSFVVAEDAPRMRSIAKKALGDE